MRVRLPFFLATVVLAGVAAQVSSPHAQRPGGLAPKKPARPPSCAPPVTQQIYAPLPNVGWGDAELVLNNNGIEPITVYSSFFRQGSTFEGAPVTVGASEARWLRLSELAGISGRGLRGYEGVELSYNGRLLEVGAQLTLLRPQGGTVDLPFSMAGEYASSEQQAVWPTAPGARSTVLLGNASDQAVSVVVEHPGGRTEELQLGARATALLQNRAADHRREENARLDADWMRLTTVGPVGSVRATGYVELQGRTMAGIRFYDPATARQSNLYASNLPLAESVPMMVLKNTSATTITATPRFFPSEGEGTTAVDVTSSVSLAPGEGKVIDLSRLMELAANRPDLAHVSVAVMSTGAPGALIGGLSAARHNGQVLSDIPLRDSGPIRQSTGTYPWRLDGDHDTVVSITNVTDGPARFHVHVRFAGGAYARTLELDAHATALFDLRELRDKAVPDREGRTIPPGATSGQFHWSILSSGGETKLAGRADITSRSAGRSTSYSCPDCCPDSFGGAFLDPWDTAVPIFETGDFQVLAQYMNCYQQYYTVGANSYYAWWDIGSPGVTSVQNVWYGLSRAFGNDAGTSSVWGYWDEELWNFAADYCWMEVVSAGAGGQVQTLNAELSVKLSGAKTAGNNLMFSQASYTCSENLGLFGCSTIWLWNLEIKATVSNDASLWTARQSYTGRKKGNRKDSSGALHPFDESLSVPNDDPDSAFVQKPSGQTILFWIDAPGHFKSLSGDTVDSLTQVQNFTSKVCSTQGSNPCFSVDWHLKLVVDAGGVLNTSQSTTGLGHVSTNF